MPRRFAFLDHPGPLAFAHRGGAAEGLENTMPAFERAIGLGYRYLETDVHATADGVLVAFHDRTLDRVTGRGGRIAEMSYTDVAAVRIGGTGRIPRLEDILRTWPEARVNIDVKDLPAIRPLADVLRRTKGLDRVCLTSFSDQRLSAVRAVVGPAVCTSLGPREVADLRLGSYTSAYGRRLGRVVRSGAGCVQVPVRAGVVPILTPSFISTAHALGLQVHAWTIDDQNVMDELLDLGVDGIMTDEISDLREVLRRRDQWAADRISA